MSSQIKVLTKPTKEKVDLTQVGTSNKDSDQTHVVEVHRNSQYKLSNLKHEGEAKTFKLIDEKDWNIITSEPQSETTFFSDGHSAMSIVSVLGPKGVGKSSLLNKIAGKEAFKTHANASLDQGSSKLNTKHITSGIDIHSTHHRMLLDCQPLLAASVLEDFLSGHSSSQSSKNGQVFDSLTSCHMISLQLTTFLIATSDYVIIMSHWLIDVHLLRLIASAIMLIGEDDIRAKLILYSSDMKIHDKKFKNMIDKCLGRNRIDRYFDKEIELLDYIAPYSSEKCDLYEKDPTTFTGKNWLTSCQRLWNTTIRNSSMFSDYASQLLNAHSTNQ